jgi:hypothetical protein
MEHQFVAEMERRFGSDESIGVTFETEDGQRLTVGEYEEMFKRLGDAMPDTVSLLPNGGSAVCCTDYAALIFSKLPGRVQIFGFANADNPTSRVARESIHPGGHDFAVVDGRFIVDPWLRLVPCACQQMVFDLDNAEDGKFALDLYGPRNCWTRMETAERYAQESKTN